MYPYVKAGRASLFCDFKTQFKFCFDVTVQTADPYSIIGFITQL